MNEATKRLATAHNPPQQKRPSAGSVTNADTLLSDEPGNKRPRSDDEHNDDDEESEDVADEFARVRMAH